MKLKYFSRFGLFQQIFAKKGDCMKTRWRSLFGTRIDMKFLRWILENPQDQTKNYKNLMLQIDPLNSSCSWKLQFHKRKLRLWVLWKSNSLEKVVVPKVSFANANVYNCSSKKLTSLKDRLMQIWKSISLSSHKNNTPKVSNHSNIYFLSYAHPRYMKCLFTNMQKQ